MIEWMVTTSRPAQTGFTSATQSYSRSASFTSAIRIGVSPNNPDTFTQTESRTTENSRSEYYLTSRGEAGQTTRSSFTEFQRIFNEWLPASTSDTQFALELQQGNYNTELVTSTSNSGETTADYGTWTIETTTTETYESVFFSTVSEFEGTTTAWTTSQKTLESESKTEADFLTTQEEGGTTFQISEATREATRDATTTSGTSTLAASNAFATVAQANTRDENAEILYVISNRATNWNGFSAALPEAQSGTRLTLVPSYFTTQVSVSSTQSDISTTEVTEDDQTALLAYVTTVSSSATRTHVLNRFVLPNSTTTQTFADAVSVASTFSYVALGGYSFVYGFSSTWPGAQENATTVATTAWGQTWETRLRWRHTLSFNFLSSRPFSSEITTSSAVRLTESFSSASSTAFLTSFTLTESYEYYPDEEAEEAVSATDTLTFSTSEATGLTSEYGNTIEVNAYAPAPSAVGLFAGGGGFSRTRWVESGAALGDQKGLFFTAPQSCDVFNTARAGDAVHLTQYLPGENAQTINSNSITYSTTSSTTGSTTSTLTTSSMTFSLIGATFATVASAFSDNTASRILPAGGGAFSATVVERAAPGVYVDLIDGSTTSFGGDDTTYAPYEEGGIDASNQPAARKKWGRTAELAGMGAGSEPLFWLAPRNSTALPPSSGSPP
jgi:hypothetical protein